MMSRRKLVLLLAMALLLVLVGPALAQEPAVPAPAQEPAAGPRMAIVDVERLEKEYKALRDKQSELEKLRGRDSEILQEVSQYSFLSAELFKEVVAIASLPQPWPEDKAARAAELRKISEDKEKEFLALRANTQRTPEQEDRFKELQDLVQAREADMRQLEQSFLQQLLNHQRQLQTELLTHVRETIRTVAKDKKYDFVFDNSIVFFGGDDITEDVLQVLNAEPASQEPPKTGEQGETGGQ